MRYPDGGGLTTAGRARRECVRLQLQAAHLFEQDVSPVQVARRLRVSTKSAYQWRRRWRAGGGAALASKALVGWCVGDTRTGPPGTPCPGVYQWLGRKVDRGLT